MAQPDAQPAAHPAPLAVHAERAPLRAYPPTLTFHDLIRKNRIESALLMCGMGLLAVLVGAAIAGSIHFAFAVTEGLDAFDEASRRAHDDTVNILPSALLGAGVMAVLAAIGSLWSWYGGDKAILRMTGAREIEKKDDPQLFNVVDELRLAAGVPMPRVYLIESDALNAFATGRDPRHGSVAITTGLRKQLTRDELAGVMAHEIAHVRHYDIRFAMLMATLVGLIVFACDAFLRTAFRGSVYGRRSSGRGKGGSGGGGAAIILVLVLALLLSIIAPLLAKIIQFSISRSREYLADAGAVELTRYPEGLASALRKLADCSVTLPGANRATAHLFIVNPSKAAVRAHQRRSSVFSTHPPIQNRIERLEALLR